MAESMFRQKFITAFCSLALIALSGVAISAQVPTLRKLIGAVTWSKEMGVPPTDSLCGAFNVSVYDADNLNKPVWFANVLTPGRDDPQYYICRYEITLPTNKRLLVTAGFGEPFSSQNDPAFLSRAWQGEPNDAEQIRREHVAKEQAETYRREFTPAKPHITLVNKDVYLKFELKWRLIGGCTFWLGKPCPT